MGNWGFNTYNLYRVIDPHNKKNMTLGPSRRQPAWHAWRQAEKLAKPSFVSEIFVKMSHRESWTSNVEPKS